MKQLLAIILFPACCYSTLLSAQQTYIRNYSTFTEYGTIPAATVPSSYKPFTIPAYTPPERTYLKEEEKREETPEDRMRERFSDISAAYQQKNYDGMINLSYGFDPSVLQPYYGRETFYAMLLNSYIYLNRKKELVDYFLNAPPDIVLFSDRAFCLIVADELRAANHFSEACIYFDKAKAQGVYNNQYQLSYCIALAEVDGRKQQAREAFDRLLENDETHAPLNYYYYGKFLLRLNSADALSYLDIFIEKSSEKYDGYLLRSHAAFLDENYEKCIADAKEYKKNRLCSECDALIQKATAVLNDPEYIAEQKKKTEALAEQHKQQEAVAAEQNRQVALLLAEQKQKAESKELAFKKYVEEFNEYIRKHDIVVLNKKNDAEAGKRTSYKDALVKSDLLSVYILFKQGNDINVEYERNSFTLFTALKYSDFDIAHFLIINGFDLKKIDHSDTPLHVACERGTGYSKEVNDAGYKVAKLLIEKGADVNAVNRLGNTPLHYAASNNNTQLAKLLLENGAKADIKNNEHRTPAGVARFFGHDEFVNFLKNY